MPPAGIKVVDHNTNLRIKRNKNLRATPTISSRLATQQRRDKNTKQMAADIGPIFAHLHNGGFKINALRNIEKSELEYRLHTIAHKLRKVKGDKSPCRHLLHS